MRKLLTILLALALIAPMPASAVSLKKNEKGKMQMAKRDFFQIGPTLGMSFMDIKNINKTNIEFQGGVTMQLNLPLGMTIQPSVLYNRTTAVYADPVTSETLTTTKTGYLTVPVALQWGPDLIICRPYLEAVPFLGYALHNTILTPGGKARNQWDGLNRFELGVGVGVGVDIWRFQVSYRYMWSLTKFNAGDPGSEIWKSALRDRKYRGSVISVSFLF